MPEVEHPSSVPDTVPLPLPKRVQRRAWLPNLVWLIPIVAAVAGLSLVFKVISERGPIVTISFHTAEGLEAGKTKVKYKDVDIGLVQAISLAPDRSSVKVTVQLAKEAEGFNVADTRFWVVRPRVAVSGVSGLNTLFSGAYIGVDGGVSSERRKAFIGLEGPPSVTRDVSGRQFVLHAADLGSLDIGSPVYYRRIRVGQVVTYDLDSDGKGVTLRIFINSPYEQFVGRNTRFWHASGFDVQVDAGGVKFNTESLASVVLGGIAFQSPDAEGMGMPAQENAAFSLASDQSTALNGPDGEAQTLLLYFNQSLRGLVPGAAVDFRGVVIGEVKSIGVTYDPGKRAFSMPVVVQIYPARLGQNWGRMDTANQALERQQRLRQLVEQGLRAQLRTGNFLTGQLYVALDFFPKAPPARLDISASPFRMPTVANSLDELQDQLAEITRRLSKVPFDEIGGDVQTTLRTMSQTLASVEQLTRRLSDEVAPEAVIAMRDVRKTLATAEQTLAADAPLQQDVRQTLQELTRAATSIRQLSDYLERHPDALIRGRQEDGK